MVASPGLGREPRPGDRQPTCLPLVLEVPNVGSVILPTSPYPTSHRARLPVATPLHPKRSLVAKQTTRPPGRGRPRKSVPRRTSELVEKDLTMDDRSCWAPFC